MKTYMDEEDRGTTLDPADWPGFRAQAHRMLDDMLDYIRDIRERPVWQAAPEEVRQRFRSDVPQAPSDLPTVHAEFLRDILPYAAGNVHPGFMGWVHGAGTPVGMVAEMLAAGLNANLGGRDHAPIEVERQMVRWMQRIFGFPESASGLFVTGTSMANLIGVLIARDAELGFEVRCAGVAGSEKRLAAYASAAAHSCIAKALDMAGIGSDALRPIAVDGRHRISLEALRTAIVEDRRRGFTPFLVVGNAGTVDIGAIDDLAAMAELCREERLWFHVDGACGALAMLAPDLAPRLAGIERADSLAFDFHKWGQVPYDAGFILVRDGVLHRKAFATSAPYLRRELRGLAAGAPWPCDFGPDLSRGFRALKTWFTLKVYGTAAMGAAISRTCALARYLEQCVAARPELELLAPVELNVVCFGYRSEDAQRINPRIVIELQESGVAAPSTTTLDGRIAIRAAIVNHRTTEREIDLLVEKTVALGQAMESAAQASQAPAAAVEQDWPLRRAREESLRAVEARIAADDGDVSPRCERAGLLAELGRTVEARDAYIDVIRREPGHRLALNNLGTLLYSTGYRSAARTAYAEAVARHPDDPMGHVNLGNILQEMGEHEAARESFEAALRVDPGHAEAHQGLGYVLAELGDAAGADRHRRLGFQDRAVQTLPYRGSGAPVPLLLLVSSVGGNIPTRYLLDDRVFQTHVVLPEFYDRSVPLPPHELVFNAIGDADLAAGALSAAQSVVALTKAPVINSPAAVMATGRADHARLRGLAGCGGAADGHAAARSAGVGGRAGGSGAAWLPLPAAGAHAGVPHRAAFRESGKRGGAGGRGGAIAWAGDHDHRVSGCARAGRQGEEVSRHDDRRRTVSAARGDFQPVEDSLFHGGHGGAGRPSGGGCGVSGAHGEGGRQAGDGGAGEDPGDAGTGLRRDRFRFERGGGCAAVRGERHHGGESAGSGRAMGIPASGGRADLRGGAADAAVAKVKWDVPALRRDQGA